MSFSHVVMHSASAYIYIYIYKTGFGEPFLNLLQGSNNLSEIGLI